MPEYLLDSISKNITTYEYAQSEDYDYAAIYKVAKIVGISGTLAQLLKLIFKDDPLLRYWASLAKYKEALPLPK